MIPNMKFYVISIVAIFAALGIGIYMGFTLDAQSIIVEQKEDIAAKLEERFDYLRGENEELKSALKEIEKENDDYIYFINSTYGELVKSKLDNINVAIIETKNDYMYSGVGQILEMSGAKVVNVTTISDKFMNEEVLKGIYGELETSNFNNNIISNSMEELTKSIVNGEESELVKKMIEKELIDIVGFINESVDYIIIAGGSVEEGIDRVNLIDKTIVDVTKKMNKEIVGIEKLKVDHSYMGYYKGFRISTVDNIDTTIGKVSLILTMEGRPGHYGVKSTAEELIPNLSLSIFEYSKER